MKEEFIYKEAKEALIQKIKQLGYNPLSEVSEDCISYFMFP